MQRVDPASIGFSRDRLNRVSEWLEEQEMDWVLNSAKLDTATTVAAAPR